MPYVLFAIPAVVATVLCSKLPETRGKSLPDTIADL
jgi:hypothetical protein